MVSILKAGDLRGYLARGMLGSLLIRTLVAALALLTSVLLARLLGAEGYGTYAFALALVTLVAVPVQRGLPMLVIRYAAAYQARQEFALLRGLLSRLGRVSVAASVGLGAVAAAVLWFLSGPIEEQLVATLWVSLALIPAISIATFCGAWLQGLRRVVLGQFVADVTRPLILVIVLGVVYAHSGALGFAPEHAMAMHVLAAFLSLTTAGWLLFRGVPRAWRRSREPAHAMRLWMRSAWPLAILGGMQVLNNQVDVLMLGLMKPVEEVGVYRVAVAGAHVVAFSLAVVNPVVAPQMSRLYARETMSQLQRLVTVSARVTLVLAVMVATVFLVFGRDILEVLYGVGFDRGYTALAILSTGQLANAAAGSVGVLLSMTGHERDHLWGTVAGLVVNVGLNVLLIPRWGLEGAALANAVALAAWNGILIFFALKRTRIDPTALGLFSGV